MDITRDNFHEGSKDLLDNLEKCKIVSLDLEFSGIKPDIDLSRTDTPYERYKKSFNLANKYKIIQFGLSLFIHKGIQGKAVKTEQNKIKEKMIKNPDLLKNEVNDCNEYEVFVYNFYLFPSTFDKMLNLEFLVDVSAIEYLNGCESINFEQWIKKGVNYFNQTQIKQIKQKLFSNIFLEVYSKNGEEETLFGKIKDEIEKDFQEFSMWLIRTEEKEFKYEKGRQSQKFLIKKIIKNNKELDCLYFEERKEDKNNFRTYLIVIKCLNLDEKNLLIKNSRKSKIEYLNRKLEFSILWDEIKNKINQKQIPIIGHNMFLDLLFIYSHFEKQLTKDYFEYKKHYNQYVFPLIYDTKVLSNLFDFSKSHLEFLFKELIIISNINFKLMQKSNQQFISHNAGYDAYMTGAVFLIMEEFFKKSVLEKYSNCVNIFGRTFYSMKMDSIDKDHLNYEFVYVLKYQKIETPRKIRDIINNKIVVYEKKNNLRISYNLTEKKNTFSKERVFFFIQFFFKKENLDSTEIILKSLNKLKNEFEILNLHDYVNVTTKM